MPEKKSKVAEIKTKQTSASIEDFLNAIADEQKRKDSFVLLEMMKKASREEPKMWGGSMIGFGQRRYKSPATGREVDWLVPDRFLASQSEFLAAPRCRYAKA